MTFHRSALLMVLLLATTPTQAHEGFLDGSFLYNGWQQFDEFIGGERGRFQALRDAKVDAQGRVIAIGTFSHPGTSRNADCMVFVSTPAGRDVEVLRALPLDRGGGVFDHCNSVESLPDGRIVAVGYATRGDDRATGVVVRLNADGTPDTSYFDQGVFELNDHVPWIAASESTLLIDSLLDAQGRLLVVGRAQGAGTARGLLARFLADGSLDTAFGVDGAVALADFNPPLVVPTSLTLDAQGRILVLGTTQQPGSLRHGVIFRVLDDGALDTGFGGGMNGPIGNGGGGRGFVPRCDRVSNIAVDASGRMLVGCEPDVSGATPGPILAAGVLRLTAQGQPDTSFGGDGLVEPLGFTSPMGTLGGPPRIALQADGKIVLAATLAVADQPGNTLDWYVARLQPGGAIDTGFGYQSGYSRLRLQDPQGTSNDVYWEGLANLVLDPRGRPILVGQRDFSGQATRFVIARLGLADPMAIGGFLDPEFNQVGYRTERFGEVPGPRQDTIMKDIARDASGRMTTIGRLRFDTNPSPTYQCVVARMLADGQYDTSFAPPTGRRTLSLNANGANNGLCESVLALDDGSTLIAGNSGFSGTLVRLLPDGSVDTAFYGNGAFETWTDLNFEAQNKFAYFVGLARDSQGRILLTGYTATIGAPLPDQFGVVVRLRADLSVDTGFGENGVVRLHTFTNPFRVLFDSIVEDSTGRLYVGGTEGLVTDGNQGGVVYRLLADGSYDTTFPGEGYLRLRGTCDQSGDIAVDAQDRALVTCYRASDGQYGVLRLLENGQSDLNFGSGGVAAIRFTAPSDSNGRTQDLQQILPMADGKVVVVGTHRNLNGLETFVGPSDIGVARLNPNGSGDPDFGRVNGANLHRLPVPYGQISETGAAALLQADGRIVIAGTRFDLRPGVPTLNNSDVVVLRVGNPVQGPLADPVFENGFEE